MSDKRLRFLFHRYFDKSASAEERAELMALLGRQENDDETYVLLREAWERMEAGEPVFTGEQSEDMLRGVLGADTKKRLEAVSADPMPVIRRPLIGLRRVMTAAVVLLLLASAAYFQFFNRGSRKGPVVSAPLAAKKNESISVPAPSGNNAVLTLSDGSIVVLDSAKNGALATQGDAQVSKANAGRLVYNALSREPAPEKIVYNTVSTRRGGAFQIVLPDGTKVWLNTVSSLRFPTAFAGAERVVELTGEAYFEVEKNSSMPFRVHVKSASDKGMDVQVLGTHFNVMAYEDEAEIKTTLLEGAVKVVNNDKSSVLTPGEQVKLNKQGIFSMDENPDVDLTMAWKNGFISFKSADIRSIMRLVERWYDIEVVYAGDVPGRTFSGGISRDANLSELVRVLEVSKIHFTMEGRKLTVTP